MSVRLKGLNLQTHRIYVYYIYAYMPYIYTFIESL